MHNLLLLIVTMALAAGLVLAASISVTGQAAPARPTAPAADRP
jgi:hypothetical protein